MFKKNMHYVFITVFILLLLIIFYKKNTTEYLTIPTACTALNQDPYDQPGHKGYYVDCCNGSKMEKKNWDNNGKYYFKCTSTQPPVTNCTKEGGNAWSKDNIHTPCCSGLTEIVDPSTGYLICSSGSKPPVTNCTKEGGNAWSKDNIYTPCCSGFTETVDPSTGYLICSSGSKPPVTNCTKEGGNAWSKDNIYTPCCSGFTETVDPSTGYLICRSGSKPGPPGPDPGPPGPDPGPQCMNEGDPAVVKDSFTKCCQGLVQDTSRPGWITCKSQPSPGPQYGQKVVIVVRHGDKDDSNAWTSASRPNCVYCTYKSNGSCDVRKNRSCEYITTTLPNGQVVNYHNVTLVDSGINEGNAFATVLPEVVHGLGVAHITKAIIFDPRPVDSAANSFQTILPFLIKNDIQKVDFFTDPNVFNNISQTLENNDGSIIVAANHEVLWEANTGVEGAQHPINGSILNILGKIYNINNNNIPNPVRGKTIYVFSNPNKMDVYNMDANSRTYK
jgi:hypothetical protein